MSDSGDPHSPRAQRKARGWTSSAAGRCSSGRARCRTARERKRGREVRRRCDEGVRSKSEVISDVLWAAWRPSSSRSCSARPRRTASSAPCSRTWPCWAVGDAAFKSSHNASPLARNNYNTMKAGAEQKDVLNCPSVLWWFALKSLD